MAEGSHWKTTHGFLLFECLKIVELYYWKKNNKLNALKCIINLILKLFSLNNIFRMFSCAELLKRLLFVPTFKSFCVLCSIEIDTQFYIYGLLCTCKIYTLCLLSNFFLYAFQMSKNWIIIISVFEKETIFYDNTIWSCTQMLTISQKLIIFFCKTFFLF